MPKARALERDEITKIWSIDRSERIENTFYLEEGHLKLKPDPFEAQGWPPKAAEQHTPGMFDCFDRGGWFYGLFEDETLVGIAVLETKFIGETKDQLQLSFFHVDSRYRHKGYGKQLLELAKAEAKRRGAKSMYVSATPTENTIHFYLKQGCQLAAKPDPELFKLEPEDIHLLCPL